MPTAAAGAIFSPLQNPVNEPAEIERLRAAWRDAERRLQAVVEMSGPHIGTFEFELDAVGRLIFVGADATAARLVTVAHAGHFGKPLLEVFTGMAGTELPEALLETARSGKVLGERSFVPPGTRLARAFELFAFQSAPRRVTMKFWESTRATETQEIARRNQELLTRVFSESPVAIALVREADDLVVDVNAQWSRLTGFAREEALGHSAQGLGLWPRGASLVAALSAAPGAVQDLPLPFTTPDGRSLSLSLHGAVIVIGGVRHFLVYLTDLTAWHAAEAELKRLNAELEQRIQQRTAELARARDEAERHSRAKSEFLSGMSHELRTPMNAILGFGQLLDAEASQGLTARQHGYVRQILRAGRHLLELITEVLDLARIEAGKLQVSLEPVYLATVLDECLMLMQPVAAEHGVTLLPTAPADCRCHVRADRMRLRQVLLNLLSNAIKYNREGGRVWVACSADGARARIGVTDTGPGLSVEQQRRLFRDFERLDADRDEIEGSGIGLAPSRRLVMLMNGEIGVDSEPGSGSTFWVRLPLAEPAAAPAAVSTAASATVPAPETAVTRTVLYVEDNPANVALMEAALAQRPGVRLVTAALPQLGLDIARASPPDLILLDIQLPGMDGFELLRRLRQAESTRRVPAVAISANAMPADVERGLAAGFARYLTKPLDLNRLLQAVDELVWS